MTEISLIIPCFRSEKSIEIVVNKIIKYLHNINYEIILINDGSQDKTQEVILSLYHLYPDLIICIELSKNYGEFNAVMCGMNHCNGNYIVILDDDLQQNPADIPKLYKSIVSLNSEVVYAKYFNQKHSAFRIFFSFLAHSIINLIYFLPLNSYISSFKIIRKSTVDKIIKYKGPFPYIDGLILNNTRNIANITVEHQHRIQGKSNYTISKLLNYFLSTMSSHNSKIIITIFILLFIFIYFYCISSNYYILLLTILLAITNTAFLYRYLQSNYSEKPQFTIKSIHQKNQFDYNN